jgi:hypothetical protein
MIQDKLKAIRIGDQVSYQIEVGREATGVCVGWSDTAGIGARFLWSERTREKYILIDDEKRVPLNQVMSRSRDSGIDAGVITWR